MGFPAILKCRWIVAKVLLLHFIAFQAANARPSPIIRFPGDDTPRTDKEVALVSLFLLDLSRSASCETHLLFYCFL